MFVGFIGISHVIPESSQLFKPSIFFNSRWNLDHVKNHRILILAVTVGETYHKIYLLSDEIITLLLILFSIEFIMLL